MIRSISTGHGPRERAAAVGPTRLAGLTVLGALLAATLASAATAATSTPAATASSSVDLHGTVLSVNPGMRTFAFRSRERGTLRIEVRAATRFERLAGLAALRTGRRLEVYASKSGRVWLATKIEPWQDRSNDDRRDDSRDDD